MLPRSSPLRERPLREREIKGGHVGGDKDRKRRTMEESEKTSMKYCEMFEVNLSGKRIIHLRREIHPGEVSSFYDES